MNLKKLAIIGGIVVSVAAVIAVFALKVIKPFLDSEGADVDYVGFPEDEDYDF